MTFILSLMCFGGYYFSNATVYNEVDGVFQKGIHITLDDKGTVTLVASSPITAKQHTVIDGALVLPHYSDFYSLVQERGLGLDRDIDDENQRRIAAYYQRIGIQLVRDPVFPPAGLGAAFSDKVNMMAQRGYLEVTGGPGRNISMVVDPQAGLDAAFAELPEQGPITLWWSSAGGDGPVLWPKHRDFLQGLISRCRTLKRPIGCYVQDAPIAEMGLLASFEFDFLEGVPDGAMDPKNFSDIVWVPLASLNDQRYCAKDLEARLDGLEGMHLYDEQTLTQARGQAPDVHDRIRERCNVWLERRSLALTPLRQWIKADGKLALGSGGGHMFSFSGGLGAELETLKELGASDLQLLRAAFATTPGLLGNKRPYLKSGRPANFIVYTDGGGWLNQVGKALDYNFVDGENVLNGALVSSTLPKTSKP